MAALVKKFCLTPEAHGHWKKVYFFILFFLKFYLVHPVQWCLESLGGLNYWIIFIQFRFVGSQQEVSQLDLRYASLQVAQLEEDGAYSLWPPNSKHVVQLDSLFPLESSLLNLIKLKKSLRILPMWRSKVLTFITEFLSKWPVLIFGRNSTAWTAKPCLNLSAESTLFTYGAFQACKSCFPDLLAVKAH